MENVGQEFNKFLSDDSEYTKQRLQSFEIAMSSAKSFFPINNGALQSRLTIAHWIGIPFFKNIYQLINNIVGEEGCLPNTIYIYLNEIDERLLAWVKDNLPEEIYKELKELFSYKY